MSECSGKKFILNGELHLSESFYDTMIYEGDSIYEVIRLMKGRPVFFYDHMERLALSAAIQKKQMLADVQTLRKAIIKLSQSENAGDTNLKIVFNYNEGSDNFLVYLIDSVYPTNEQYETGVKGILYFAERKNPEAKMINHKLRSSIYHKLILEGAYEALLVNENKCITEGSRSNIFFVKNDTLVTAPDNVILNGITRKHILNICTENDIRVIFKCVSLEELPEYDAVLMTGTSPMVLPFYCIDNILFKVKLPVVDTLRFLYKERAENSLMFF